MASSELSNDRAELLADVAEMYYQQGKTQAEISKIVGITRSAISRILTEARQKGIVEIHVHRPLQFSSDLESRLIQNFNLLGARVVNVSPKLSYLEIKNRLGITAAKELRGMLRPQMVIGIAWGTTVKGIIDAIPSEHLPDTRVIQLLGVLGSTRHSYSGQTLVESLAMKLGGEGVYLYTPFMVETEDSANILKNDPNIRDALLLGKSCDLAILGVGSIKPDFCSLFQGEHITISDLEKISRQNAVGDVSGHYFDIHGNRSDVEFHKRLIGISAENLKKVPIRLGAAGGIEKSEAILGALRGGYLNYLITDNQTAEKVLELEGME